MNRRRIVETTFFPSAMQRRIARVLLLLALAGCGGAEPIDAPPGDARSLAGTWRVELRSRGLPGFRAPPGSATVELAPQPFRDSMGHRVAARGLLEGRFRLEARGSVRLPTRPVGGQGEAGARVFADGRVIVGLATTGNCADCGNVVLAGRRDGDAWRGTWSQESLVDVPGGRFVLRRAEPPPP